jgi:DNA mismatch repair protein MutH
MIAAPLGPVPPPRDEDELCARVHALVGRSLDEIAAAHGVGELGSDGVHTKGRAGALLERALGATGGAAAQHDFPHLGIELKTIPVDERGRPRESTFVCAISLAAADRADWATSWVRAKLSHVLWVPLVAATAARPRRVGPPLFWRPTPAQERGLAADFEDLMGLIGIGGIEEVTAHEGRWLQVRPKAASSRVRTVAFGPDGEWLATVPRGFYLRARFTGHLLRDPTATP